ncbi:hypothetical protein LSTR_LSTR000718 [Laodelphax striatellus]|uniref:Uncharacterized protein n=1 Tax=Laodelphax striatellus TaxID=195883 RepID=A0A482XFW8_LAOST|nr:hypothetical protein LSTR_LSTR000718 [Laodelphax striatellus]
MKKVTLYKILLRPATPPSNEETIPLFRSENSSVLKVAQTQTETQKDVSWHCLRNFCRCCLIIAVMLFSSLISNILLYWLFLESDQKKNNSKNRGSMFLDYS